jgi:hypothetical protein
MTFQYPSPGPGDVASYMTSGLPWVSSSVIASGTIWRVDFPYVTSYLYIHNAGGASTSNMGLAFTLAGASGSNMFYLGSTSGAGGDYFKAPVRVKTIYLTALTANVTASIYAGLTVIKTTSFPTLTGSSDPGLSGSIPDPVFGYNGLG